MSYELPLVSVIMPVLNNENYLRDAVNSILSQSYINLELIIIDENKHELCLEIMNSFNDPRIRYFNGPKKNLSAALNMGIDCANGAYIARMDSDDIAHLDRIAIQVKTMQENNWQICGTWIKLFGQESGVYKYPADSNDIRYSMMFSCAIAHPTVLAKAELFRKFKYNDQILTEDWELWTRMLKADVIFGNIPIPLLDYRRHAEAVSHSASSTADRRVMDSIKILKSYAIHLFNADIVSPYTNLSCGVLKKYELTEIEILCDFLYGIFKKGLVTRELLFKMIPVYFRKGSKINIKLFLCYLKLLKAYELPIISRQTFYMAVLSIFKVKRNSKLYMLKKFISSTS